MTTVERLIRRTCEEAKARVMTETQTELRKLPPREVRVDSLPKHVQALYAAFYTARTKMTQAEARLERFGWDVRQQNRQPVKAYRHYDAHHKLQNTVTDRRAARIRQIDTFRTETTIACMGLSPLECRAAVRKIQDDLGKV